MVTEAVSRSESAARKGPARVAAEYLAIPVRPNLAYGAAFLGSLAAGVTNPVLFLGAAILLGLTFAARPAFSTRLQPGSGRRVVLNRTHNPEFVMLEASGDYTTVLTLMREMIQRAAVRSCCRAGPQGTPCSSRW